MNDLRLTTKHVIHCTDAQLWALCGRKGRSGQHLNHQSPHITTLRLLAKWFGGDLNQADHALRLRQEHWFTSRDVEPSDEERRLISTIRAEVKKLLDNREANEIHDSTGQATGRTPAC